MCLLLKGIVRFKRRFLWQSEHLSKKVLLLLDQDQEQKT